MNSLCQKPTEKVHTKRSFIGVVVFVNVKDLAQCFGFKAQRGFAGLFWFYLTHVLDLSLDYDENSSSFYPYYSSFFFHFYIRTEENSSQTFHIKIILFMYKMRKTGGDGKKSSERIFEGWQKSFFLLNFFPFSLITNRIFSSHSPHQHECMYKNFISISRASFRIKSRPGFLWDSRNVFTLASRDNRD